jgi:hypothetical protein
LFTIITIGICPTSATGAKSATGSKDSRGKSGRSTAWAMVV